MVKKTHLLALVVIGLLMPTQWMTRAQPVLAQGLQTTFLRNVWVGDYTRGIAVAPDGQRIYVAPSITNLCIDS